ncbi:membrane dipeptidase [Lacrimispora sp. 210928-DFI.3.58]|uniref:membrane dipeptidase n=1 Tax=Lacrimispora sp. 210928-DFI.3.58 TaxID=2883214 RepID=UPI003FA5F6A1
MVGGGVFSIVKADTPVIASHSNARGLCGIARNLSDSMIRLIGEHGGVAGINFCGMKVQMKIGSMTVR